MANHGHAGTAIQVRTNSFEITAIPTMIFYQYDVIAQLSIHGEPPKVMPPGRRYREIIDHTQDTYPDVFTPRASFDGSSIMYSSINMQARNFDVNMSRNPNSNSGRFIVKITRVGQIEPTDLQRLTTAAGAQRTQANAIAINLIQIIVSQAPNIAHNFALHSKSFYVDYKSKQLPSGLQAWTGFFQSVRPVLNRIVINIDTTTAAVYKPVNLLSYALEVMGCRNVRDLMHKCRSGDEHMKLAKFFKGVRVEVGIKGQRQRRGPIAEIIPEAGPYQFPKEGGMTTVQEHFKEKYGLHISEPGAFGVRIGKDAVFPAEFCKVMPGQVYKKRLNPSDMQEFLKVSVMRPKDRINAIREAVAGDLLKYNTSLWMQNAGLSVSTTPLEITGRELKAPSVIYKDSNLAVRGGAWNVVGRKFQVPAKILAWAVVCFDTSQDAKKDVHVLCTMLLTNLQKLGVTFYESAPYMAMGNQQNVQDSLQRAAQVVKAGLEKRPDHGVKDPQVTFILVVLPQNAAVIRRQTKHWSEVTQGIATQCVRQGKYGKANDQYCNNLALKINIKCGGRNSFVVSNANALIKESMIVGCDVSHPSPGVHNRPSIAGVVTSIDPEATRYHAAVRAQEPRQEIITDIAEMIRGGLNDYYKEHRKWPQNLVVFRDGVSEGEYSQIEEREIKALEDLLTDLHKNTGHRANLVFVVVGKRHHVRFFPQEGAGDRIGNCNPGLVVDREIVHSTYMDFYLQSHAGIIGTSRPSHYIVLKNTCGWTADQIQELSYALCHVYGAATRAVSIPAPVYYADRVCARAEYQFDTNLDLYDEGSSNADFKLETWQKGLGQSRLKRHMYFV